MKKTDGNDDNEKKSEVMHQDLDTFHSAIWPVMVIGQCFAIMPLAGIFRKDPKHVKFTWKTPGMFVTLSFLFCGTFITFSFAKDLISGGIDAKNIVGLVFFSCGLTACLLFTFLAKEWPSVIQLWTKVELIFLEPPYVTPKRKLRYRVRLAASAIILFSLFEHGLFHWQNIYNYNMYKQLCNLSHTISYKDFAISHTSYVYSHLTFSVFLSIVIFVINGIFTFIWNYMDLFIIVICLGIAIRFEQIGVRIRSLADSNVTEEIWIEIRAHYVKMCELLEVVDSHLSTIILLSCVNNLYFICYQLLNIFNKLRWPISYIYFWYSLLYLIGRTAALFLCAASINDESKAPLKVLRNVPSEFWCGEIERFIFQITTQIVALSGKKFFYLTRKMLFGDIDFNPVIMTNEILLFCGNIFGVMPVSGVLSNDARFVKFSWNSWQTMVACIMLALGTSEIILSIRVVFSKGLKLNTAGPVTFYLVCDIGMVLFFLLATKWPQIIKTWRQAEKVYLNQPYTLYLKQSLRVRVRLIAAIIFFIAFVEHLLYLGSSFYNNYRQIKLCNLTISFWENFVRRERVQIYEVIPFSQLLLPVIMWQNICMTFCWNFIDVFIMIASIGLTIRFNQMSARLRPILQKVTPDFFWKNIRSEYLALNNLLKLVDDNLSGIVLLSCSNNLYYICVQFYNSFQKKDHLLDEIYFWFSLCFVIFRTLCMLFHAAAIHDASRALLSILREIPSFNWTLEVQRLTEQIGNEPSALSGQKFFYITRRLILAMVGTVVTYELVLLDTIEALADNNESNFCNVVGRI